MRRRSRTCAICGAWPPPNSPCSRRGRFHNWQMTVGLPPGPLRIHELTLLEVRGSEARLRAHCSGGTYMRSIAHDLGQALGCGAHLRDLRRMASAEFTLQQARTIPQLQQLAAENRLGEALTTAARMLPEFPSVYVEPLTAGQI